MAAANNANSIQALSDGTPGPLKITQRGGRLKGSLSYTDAEIDMLLQLMERHLPVGTQEWEYVEAEFNSANLKSLRDVISLRKKFNMLVKKKIPTGNPMCPPFVQRTKQIFSALVNKCNISPHGCIPDENDNNTIVDPVQENNNNHRNEDGDIEVVESTTMICSVDTVDHLLQNETDVSANLNELPRMAIKSIPSAKKISRRKSVHDNGDTDSNSASQILEMIRLDMQESKRRRDKNIEYCCIQTEQRHIQAEEDCEEWRSQQLRADEINAQFEQSALMFLQLLGNLINQQH